MVHDFKRFLAVADYEDNVSAFVVASAQGLVFIFTLVASQVLVRGSRSTMDDLLQSRVTKAEVRAVACTGVNVLLVMVAGSLEGEQQLGGSSLTALLVAIVGIILVQLACLYKLCQDITTGHHKFHSTRVPRLSAVVPQPPKTAVGATGTATAVDMSPVTSLPSAQDGLLATVEGLTRTVEEQQKELGEQKSAAEEEKRASDERAAKLSRLLDEQAVSLSVALEKLASLSKGLEEQRQKTEQLEAQHLCQTETRRVPL
jgi:hypothetical protein